MTTTPEDMKQLSNDEKLRDELLLELAKDEKQRKTKLSTTLQSGTALTASKPHYFLYDAKAKTLKNVLTNDFNEPVINTEANPTKPKESLHGKPSTFALETETRRGDSKKPGHVWSPVFVYTTNTPKTEATEVAGQSNEHTPLLATVHLPGKFGFTG